MKKALPLYLAIGFAAFAPVLRAWFVADDWDFLILVAPARSVSICFIPLVGRFIRPLVMATYFFNYRLFGLSPLPYHVTMVAVHAVNAWLVSLLAERLRLSRLVAFGAGLIFLVFAGHSEAVSWVAGAADPWLVLLLIPTLLVFDCALTAERGAMLLAATCVLLAACLLAKETAMTGAALLAAYGLGRTLRPLTAPERLRTITRTAIVVTITGGIAVVYAVVRSRIFGTAFGGYTDYWSTPRIAFLESRAFLLRAFLPPGAALAAFWAHNLDLIAIAVAAAGLVILFVRRPDLRPGLAFLVPAFAVGLAPVLPLSISIVDTVSERYLYVATVFSSILAAWCAEIVFGHRRVLAGAAILLFATVHLRALERANHAWSAAGELARTVTSEIVERVRATVPTARTLLLTIPDTSGGAFVVRGALMGSFRLMAPDVAFPERRVAMIADSAQASTTDHVRVERTGPRSFTVTLDQALFVQTEGRPTPEYTFDRWSPREYAITFKPLPYTVELLYASDGHMQTAAILPPTPFGSLDLPSGATVCTGSTLRFTGWALSERPGVELVLESADRPAGALRLGRATWSTGTRPDVATLFRDYPGADRAEWDWLLPCATVKAAGGRLDVRVVAVSSDGARTDLGTRTITTR
jgi:hypothetical protein